MPGSQFQTDCGIPIKAVYGPGDIADLDERRDLGDPGAPPYTRGAYPNMYRDRLWRIFQLSGYGSAEDERERIKYLLDHGETGFIMETDISTWYPYDIDHPEVLARKEDVGAFGAPLMSLKDYEAALEGIPIGEVYCHPGGVTPQQGVFSNACYFALAEKRGVPWSQLTGTGESDMMISYLGHLRKDYVPPEHALRLNCDLIEFVVQNLPRWVPLSIAGYNCRENGVNAYQELAMVMANATAYIDEILGRGKFKIDDFAHGIAGVNFAVGRDFFESICQMRAARRMWYKLMTERYHTDSPRSVRLRIHSLMQGSDYTYEQPMNNIIRGTYHALSAALGGAQSMGVPAYDEAISIPSEGAHIISLRTQQIIQHESNITSVVDPLAGSYYVEWLTKEIETKAWEHLEEIERLGGYVAVLSSGWALKEALKGAYERERQTLSGERKVVGNNCFRVEEEYHHTPAFRPNPKTWEISMERLSRLRQERDGAAVKEVLGEVKRVARSGENVMPTMLRAAKAYVTIGEIGQIWREVFGTWHVPSAF
ncbi:MAG: methylmalonyl-CoA mutase family protein [Dehalococcoidia bacterium]